MAESVNSSENSTIPPPFSPTEVDPSIPQSISDNFIRLQKIDSEQQEIKQKAVNALHQNSILAVHVIASGESPARTRLRMLRYLTGLPQPKEKNFSEISRAND